MRRSYALLAVLAACARDPGIEARLDARRAALGLGADPLPFADAMKRIEERQYEAFFARVGSRRLAADAVIDAALDLENLLARSDMATVGEARDPDPAAFDASMARSRDAAGAVARAVAGGRKGDAEARVLVASCIECHLMFRKPR